jgi:outer membrane beta-barrel protein
MRTTRILALCLLAAAGAAHAADERAPANEQVVVPQVDRRDVKPPRFPSKDIEAGVFAGTYATENFGASFVTGVRLGYHLTEDFFVTGTLGQSRVSDEAFRQVLPGGVFAQRKESLRYVSLGAGWNVLPGEVFLDGRRAKASAVYLAGGVGSTHFNEQRRSTIHFGVGMRVLMADRWALQVDMRDHVFSLDLLGKRQSTHNLELTGGFAFYF